METNKKMSAKTVQKISAKSAKIVQKIVQKIYRLIYFFMSLN
jgi:hypothetical protein